ncbi:MAG: flagellar biosynthetic protein FliR [Planctomycetes bacterium]|nr:flagellar biosynthetic protein FliR [Planctomycetota bacterium]
MQLPIVDMTWAATFSLVLARVVGVFMVAPVFSAEAVPFRLRLLMALVAAQALAAGVAPGACPAGAIALAAAVACELAIGATIGYAASMIFAGVQLGAFHVGQQMGLSLAESLGGDSPETGGVMRRFLYILAIVIFLAVGGHREVILSLRRTFQVIPPAQLPDSAGILDMVVTVLSLSFVLALKVAAPVLIALLAAAVCLGVLQRTLPQYNMLTVGLPARVLIGMAVLAASLAAFGGTIQRAVAVVLAELGNWSAAVG